MQLTPEQVQSVNVLLSAVQVAQRRGAFSLQDAATLQEAIDRLVPREEQDRQAAEAAAADASGDEAEAAVSLQDEEVAEESSEEVAEEVDAEDDVDTQPAGDSE
tara:strand:- start:1233 stop:1544 length:312 start_codon:yes stop_codon:yes gene_type:complete